MVALCLGSFDVLHYGHIQFLNRVALLGDVVVGLGTDEYQAGYKRPPVCTYTERKAALEALGYVTVERNQVSIKPLVEELAPDYLVAGSDWIDQPFLELSGVDGDYLTKQGVALVYVPRDHTMSTSELIGRIRGT